MKAFTNIEQSKKLAEILSLDSADMSYHYDIATTIPYNLATCTSTPCWSLNGLLQIMPHCIIDSRYWLTFGPLTGNSGWYVCYEEDIDRSSEYYIARSNLIDACVEIILKLNEQKLL